MIVKEFDYNGSSALKPQRKEQTIPSKETYDKKKKKSNNKEEKSKKIKNKKKCISNSTSNISCWWDNNK